jgi:hypothetical protein
VLRTESDKIKNQNMKTQVHTDVMFWSQGEAATAASARSFSVAKASPTRDAIAWYSSRLCQCQTTLHSPKQISNGLGFASGTILVNQVSEIERIAHKQTHLQQQSNQTSIGHRRCAHLVASAKQVATYTEHALHSRVVERQHERRRIR